MARTTVAKKSVWEVFIASILFIFIRQKYTSDMVTISTANFQHSDKSLNIMYKAFKELERGTLNKSVASLLGVPKNTIFTWKKKKKIIQLHEIDLGAKIQ